MNEIEIWKSIPQYEGYEASNLGRIRSVDRIITDNFNGNRFRKGTILNKGINPKGYYIVSLGRASKTITVSILIAMAFKNYKNNNQYMVVDHIDNNSLNDREDNLQIITQRLNTSKNRINKSGYTGVSKSGKKWNAIIRIKGIKTYIGTFNTPEEASEAYQTKVKELENGRL